MGLCKSRLKKCCNSPKQNHNNNQENPIPIKPITNEEFSKLYSYESAICKIKCEKIEKNENKEYIGTGFFCIINDKNIPFNKALFSNNHLLNETRIEINKYIEFEYLEKNYKIEITEDRMVFTNEFLDYTCIEILDNDNINIEKFFNIDQTIFNNKNSLKLKEIFILQYPYGKLSHDIGKILEIDNTIIKHSASTEYGSSGSPLINRDNYLIFGIHFGAEQSKKTRNDEYEYNCATSFDAIIKDIIDKISKLPVKPNERTIKTINLIYNKIDDDISFNNIFGDNFVENNKDNITLIINDKKSELVSTYNLKKGKNNIQMIINNNLTNLEYMFKDAKSLENIEGLENLNTKNVSNFSWIFYHCSSLSDIKPLRNWNVSNGNNFSGLFWECSSLSDIKPIQNWNVSNGNNFSFMFKGCSALSDINPLENWNVSNGNNFSGMFNDCSLLQDLKPLHNWIVSSGKDFTGMFSGCSQLQDVKPLENWDVSNGNDFMWMFSRCPSLLDNTPLLRWRLSNEDYFSSMFS